MSEWKQRGSVVLCQIHPDRMVHDGVYEDRYLTEVDSWWLNPDGVVGLDGDQAILQAHHRLHPTRTIDTTEKHRTSIGDEFWVKV